MSRILLGCVLGLSMLTAMPAMAQVPAARAVVDDLGARLDVLQKQLDAVRDAQGEPRRQAAMEQHWSALQDYMKAALKHTVAEPGATDAADCRVVGGEWTGLSFPGHVRSDDYLRSMQAHMAPMRQDLIELSAARDATALDAALQSHWQRNYAFLQEMRGMAWMFAGWTPAQPGAVTLPDPGSEGAQLMGDYCSVCHAVPPTRLHTAPEWAAVMTAMTRHMARSDGGIPACVRMPSARELDAIGAYLAKYAR